METKIQEADYLWCGNREAVHPAHLHYVEGPAAPICHICPGTQGSAAGTVTELVYALEALVEYAERTQWAAGDAYDNAVALLARLKAP